MFVGQITNYNFKKLIIDTKNEQIKKRGLDLFVFLCENSPPKKLPL